MEENGVVEGERMTGRSRTTGSFGSPVETIESGRRKKSGRESGAYSRCFPHLNQLSMLAMY